MLFSPPLHLENVMTYKVKVGIYFFFIYSLQHAIQPRIYMRKLIIIEKKKRTNKVFVQKSRRYGKNPVK